MISVIISTFNEENAIWNVLDTVPRTWDMGIMIVDRLSTDRTVEIARIREGEVKLNSWKDGLTNLKFLFHLRFSKII